MHKNDDWFDDMSSRVNYHAEYVPADNNRLHVNCPMWNNSIIHATHTSGNEQSRTFYYLSEKAKGWIEAHSFYDWWSKVTNENLKEMQAFYNAKARVKSALKSFAGVVVGRKW